MTAFFHTPSQTTSVQIRLWEFDTIWTAGLVQKPPIILFPSFSLFYRNNQLYKQIPWKGICANRFSYAKYGFINVSEISIGIRDCSLKGGISVFCTSKSWNILKTYFLFIFSPWWQLSIGHLINRYTHSLSEEEWENLWKWICVEWENPLIQLTWHEDYHSETSLNCHIHPHFFFFFFG